MIDTLNGTAFKLGFVVPELGLARVGSDFFLDPVLTQKDSTLKSFLKLAQFVLYVVLTLTQISSAVFYTLVDTFHR